MKKYLFLLLGGFLVWLIPFLVSFPFFDQEGNLIANFFTFKVVMALVLFISSYFIFKRLCKFYADFSPVIAILVTIAISVLIDFGTIIPFTGLSLGEYAVQILSLYLVIIPSSILIAKK